MAKPQKKAKKIRINLYLDEKLGEWIQEEAKKMGLTETAYARMLIMQAHNA